MKSTSIDHFVLTVTSIEATCSFYKRTLGMKTIEFQGNRKTLVLGRCKINLHQAGNEYEPKARRPTAGSADICLITDSTAAEINAYLVAQNVEIELGPVPRTGANGPITSFYLRDPDQNLIEVSTYQDQ